MIDPTAAETVQAEFKPKGKPRKGNGNRKKQEEQFRKKKNDDFHHELQASILKRLKISDPTNLNAVKLYSSTPPARIPVTFVGLPAFARSLWLRMKSIGTRPFATLATEENYAIFLKCLMYIAESRVIYAQMSCESTPPFPMTSLMALTEMQLRVIKQQSSRLPFPLVIYMEAIGNFNVNKQLVVPVEMCAPISNANGAVSFFPSSITKLMDACRCDIEVDGVLYNIGRRLSSLPNVQWLENVRQHQAVPAQGQQPAQPARDYAAARLADSTIQFWQFPPPSQWLLFSQIIASMENKKGFLLQFDVTTGQGSPLQVIRFPDALDPEEEETRYYMNENVSEFEEKLATALLLGVEYDSNTSGRFTSDYTECLKHGSASQSEIRHAVIWADKD